MFENANINNEVKVYVNDYLKNEVISLSPTEIVLRIFDFAILNLKKSEPRKSLKAITELIVSLNFEYKDFSIGLYNLYMYSRDQIIKGNYVEALNILEGLRDTWAKAFNLN
jgi:flagellin-specific chaperone FliS